MKLFIMIRRPEKLFSKDSLIINNAPFDTRDERKLLDNIPDFQNITLNFLKHIHLDARLTTFSPIPVSWQPVGTKGHVLVHFQHKDTIWAVRRQLEILKNSLKMKTCTATSARHLSTITCRKNQNPGRTFFWDSPLFF